jgi:threonine-phosphate decarboxylase
MDDIVRAEHGGDLADVARRHGVRRERLLDFSANVNPLGPPRALVRELVRAACDRAELTRYPDDAHGGLTQALARRHDVAPASIVIANGAAALLDAAVRVRRFARCLVPQPAFSEDRRVLAAAGTAAIAFALEAPGFRLDGSAFADAMRHQDCDACLVTNPHNPSGVLAPREEVAQMLRGARERGAVAIVDEAFIDFAPGASVLDLAAALPGAIVIRSLTKFFGVPALRAGYAVCEPALAARLRAILPPWPVTTAVARALRAGLADRAYERRTLARNVREREWLTQCFGALGIGVTPSSANFLLLELPADAPPADVVAAALVRRERIVVRSCTGYAGLMPGRFVRIAVRGRRDNARLVAAFSKHVS